MIKNFEILKGIHPGKIVGRELDKRNISQRSFSMSIGEHAQAINALIKGKRPITLHQSLKIEHALNYPEGSLLTLQAYYDIRNFKNEQASRSIEGKPNIPRYLFWDTDFDSMDWGRYRKSIIGRILERGSDADKREIARFYGMELSELEQYRPKNSYTIHLNNTAND